MTLNEAGVKVWLNQELRGVWAIFKDLSSMCWLGMLEKSWIQKNSKKIIFLPDNLQLGQTYWKAIHHNDR